MSEKEAVCRGSYTMGNQCGCCRKCEAFLLSLLDRLTDPDSCQYDHHGYCQAQLRRAEFNLNEQISYTETVDAMLDGTVPSKDKDGKNIWLKERVQMLLAGLAAKCADARAERDTLRAKLRERDKWLREYQDDCMCTDVGDKCGNCLEIDALLDGERTGTGSKPIA